MNRTYYEQLTGFSPLHWQERLYDEYLDAGELPSSIDVPTGLGKTSVMALWLIARGLGAPLPRRLVYVVDRRAVVDQATTFAETLRERLQESSEEMGRLREGLGMTNGEPLPISTLRGQHADNRRWLEDPSAASIVVGTVDMVGSRLLFEGYGVSRKMRPYHAGLLGTDTLVTLDEAHLVPPFEALLDQVEAAVGLGPASERDRAMLPRFRLLSLSATGRERGGNAFRLNDGDIEGDAVASQRIHAPKKLRFEGQGDDARELATRLADAASEVVAHGKASARCLVFCDRRDTATKVHKNLEAATKGTKATVHLFVGARRGRERQRAATVLREQGFLAGSGSPAAARLLVATSAAEVGVDLDADHLVCDLVPWERMVQRLGRVNRRGEVAGGATVRVIASQIADDDARAAQLRATANVLQEHLESTGEGMDVSPGALRRLKLRSADSELLAGLLDTATTPAPLRPSLDRATLDAWSMTALREHTGRPEPGPWLRGWDEDDKPQTRLAWRTHLPLREGKVVRDTALFLEAAPPHASEVLETETYRVAEWLKKRVRRLGKADHDATLCVLNDASDLLLATTAIEIEAMDRKRLERMLGGRTLLLDARFGGLGGEGSLDDKHDAPPMTLDGGQLWPDEDGYGMGAVSFRVRAFPPVPDEHGNPAPAHVTDDYNWHPGIRFVLQESSDGEPIRWLEVDKWRHESAVEDDRSVTRFEQELDEHQSWAASEAARLADRLGLAEDLRTVLTVAARLHDEGKRARRWQRAFSAPAGDKAYAKTQGPFDAQRLGGYRHEFGSLPLALNDSELQGLPEDLRQLVLHLIAAHHGWARPVIPTEGCEDAPPSALEQRARDVALRFSRQQERWGPWGLAYLEALLRAADQRASRRLETAPGEES